MTIDGMFEDLKTYGYVQDAPRRTYKIGEISETTGLQKTANGWVEPKTGGAKSNGGSTESAPKSKTTKLKPTSPEVHSKEELDNGAIGSYTKVGNNFLIHLRGGNVIAKNEADLDRIYGKLKMEKPKSNFGSSAPASTSTPTTSSKTTEKKSAPATKTSAPKSSESFSMKSDVKGKTINITPSADAEKNKVFKAISEKLSFGEGSGNVDNLIKKKDDGSFVMQIINPTYGTSKSGRIGQLVSSHTNSGQKLIIKPSGKGYDVSLFERGGGGNPDRTTSVGKI